MSINLKKTCPPSIDELSNDMVRSLLKPVILKRVRLMEAKDKDDFIAAVIVEYLITSEPPECLVHEVGELMDQSVFSDLIDGRVTLVKHGFASPSRT